MTVLANLSKKAYRQAERYLAGLDDDWARHILAIGPCRHIAEPGQEPCEALIRAVAHQQLHAKAAAAILTRFCALYPDKTFPDAEDILSTDPTLQRACGFSAKKLSTVRAIAQGRLDGIVPTLQEALTMSDDALIKNLTMLPGIGRWTVEMLLMYALERSDILPGDDFGVREGYRRLKNLEKAPTANALRKISEAWSPHRTVAAWYLWRAHH